MRHKYRLLRKQKQKKSKRSSTRSSKERSNEEHFEKKVIRVYQREETYAL